MCVYSPTTELELVPPTRPCSHWRAPPHNTHPTPPPVRAAPAPFRAQESFVSRKHESDKIIVFERGSARGPLLFVVNFHASASRADYAVGAPAGGAWRLVLDSDEARFGGYGRIDRDVRHHACAPGTDGRPATMRVYSPCRTAQVYALAGGGVD